MKHPFRLSAQSARRDCSVGLKRGACHLCASWNVSVRSLTREEKRHQNGCGSVGLLLQMNCCRCGPDSHSVFKTTNPCRRSSWMSQLWDVGMRRCVGGQRQNCDELMSPMLGLDLASSKMDCRGLHEIYVVLLQGWLNGTQATWHSCTGREVWPRDHVNSKQACSLRRHWRPAAIPTHSGLLLTSSKTRL